MYRENDWSIEADGIIIGSPTYFASMTAETKALIDRVGYVVKVNGNLLRRKVGVAVTVARRAESWRGKKILEKNMAKIYYVNDRNCVRDAL